MKKIMIAAAVAAMGVAAFADCAPNPEVWVYTWKFTGKTTTGKPAAAAAVNPCQPGGGGTAGLCSKAYRVPASLKIQGYTYACPAKTCSDGNTGDSLGFETAFTEPNEVFYMTKPYKASFFGGVTTEIAHIIGKNKKQAEIMGIASLTEDVEFSTFTLTYAGFGKITSSKRVTSVSGNFAGTLSQPWAVGKYTSGSSKGLYYCDPAGYWSCENISTLLCGPSIAYGKWSAKYNSTASKKFKKDGTTVKMPNWVVWENLNAN